MRLFSNGRAIANLVCTRSFGFQHVLYSRKSKQVSALYVCVCVCVYAKVDSVYQCMHVCMCVCVGTQINAILHVFVCACICLCVCAKVEFLCACVFVCLHVRVCEG